MVYWGQQVNNPEPAAMEELPMNPQSVPSEVADASFDNTRGGDHDQPYTWGRPASTYLGFRSVVRLMILRSRLETVRAERGLTSRLSCGEGMLFR